MIITFTKADVRESGSSRFIVGYDASIVIDMSGQDEFPLGFKLESPATGRTIDMRYLKGESEEYFMSNEGWDGEKDARLYEGITPEGKTILVELYTYPQY